MTFQGSYEDIPAYRLTDENLSPEECDILADVRKRAPELGFEHVYILRGTHQGITRFKIGKAKSIKDRVKLFSVRIPFDIRLSASFLVKDAYALEAKLHREWRPKRVAGEWFDFTAPDLVKVFSVGVVAELMDMREVLLEMALKSSEKPRMPDGEYIEYLESILAMNGLSFNRNKA